ncbi:MAG: hypothetical protein E6K17_09855 [Methanobacteriota archaeon]|nr:MAG: hypothetical protein E6K17_09855 [Euryarchaeota archaeon]
MASPPAGDGPPSPREGGTPGRPRPRIETLADLIFGLSLAIDAIALLPTSATTPGDMDSRILVFSFAFLFLITAWLIYTTYTSVLPVDTLAVTFLNVALLLLVALIPYLLNSVELGDNAAIRDYSSSLFALDLSGILAILAILAHILGVEENRLVPPEAAKLFRNGRNRMIVLAILMAISIAPPFWEYTLLGVQARIYMWTVPLISYWVGRAVSPQSRTYKVS